MCHFSTVVNNATYTSAIASRPNEVLNNTQCVDFLCDSVICDLFSQMDLPDNYGYAGDTKTFIAYDSTKFSVSTTDQVYKRQLREKELRGQIPRRYFRDTNYTICRLHLVESPSTELVLVSWLTDESGNAMKNHTTFKQMTSFITSLARDEQVPVVVGGTFRLAAEYARSVAPKSFGVHGRAVEAKASRESSLFVCSDQLRFNAAVASCPSKLCVEEDISVKTCDVFYWDPLFASVVVHVPLPPDEPASEPCNWADRNGPLTVANGVDNVDGGRGDDQKEQNGNVKENGYFDTTKRQTTGTFTPDELYDESLVQKAPTCYIS